jgi:hypothetical protein
MSEVADRFRAVLEAKLQDGGQDLLPAPADSGAERELRRGLHLADRAVRQWAASATAHGREDDATTAYGRLPLLRPELGHAVQEAAHAEQKTGLDAERELIAQMAWSIGERLAGLDAEAPPVRNQPSLNEIAVRAAEILLAAGRVLADPEFALDEANEALREVVPPG